MRIGVPRVRSAGPALGEHPLAAPDDARQQRHAGLARHPHGAGLEVLEVVGLRDGGLGEDADDLAAAAGLDGGAVAVGGGARAVDRDVLHAAHQRPADPVVEHLLLGHEAHEPAGRPGGEPGEGEVEVADVVDRHDGAARAGDVLVARDGEAQPEAAEDGAREADDGRYTGSAMARTLAPRPLSASAARLAARRTARRRSGHRGVRLGAGTGPLHALGHRGPGVAAGVQLAARQQER